jgi:hypothetical protein
MAAGGTACNSPGGGRYEQGITWYDVFGALPGAEAREVNSAFEVKAALLSPDMIAGAPRTWSRRSRGHRKCHQLVHPAKPDS